MYNSTKDKMKSSRILSVISAIFATLIISGCANSDAPAKYVFLFIGDGMGLNHTRLATEEAPVVQYTEVESLPVRL